MEMQWHFTLCSCVSHPTYFGKEKHVSCQLGPPPKRPVILLLPHITSAKFNHHLREEQPFCCPAQLPSFQLEIVTSSASVLNREYENN